MSKIVIALLMIFSVLIKAQINFSSWSNNYMQINSYSGNSNPDFFTTTFAANGNLNLPYWKLSIKLKQPITSANGQYTFPANKLSIQPMAATGQAFPNPTPSFAQIGAPANLFLQENAELFLVPQSNAPLYNNPTQPNGYYNLQLRFGFTVAGGAYLGNYPAWITFNAPVEFTAYDRYNNMIGKTTENFQLQIGTLSGTPPVSQEMSLQVNTNATNSLLELKSMQDYNNGSSVIYPSGLKVSSNTNFQIKVRSLQSHLQSNTGNTIPVGVVNVTLQPLNPQNQTVFPVALSTNSQILLKGNTTQTTLYSYDIKYFTSPLDQQLINAKSEDYSTTLQYEITPQ